MYTETSQSWHGHHERHHPRHSAQHFVSKSLQNIQLLTLCTGIGSFETFLLSVMEWQTICHTRLELFLKPCFNLIVWSVICLNVTRVLLNGVKHKTYHSYGVRSNNLCGCEDSEICKIRQHINSCHKW